MRHMGKAGLILTVAGLVLSAITYHDAWHNSLWCTTDEENFDDRKLIVELADKVAKQWHFEEECNK